MQILGINIKLSHIRPPINSVCVKMGELEVDVLSTLSLQFLHVFMLYLQQKSTNLIKIGSNIFSKENIAAS